MKFFRFLCIFLMASGAAIAAPGAHGPDGEHLDGAGVQARGAAAPRIETFTETFELVGRLQGGELSILIDRYETNEPVLNARLEVEFNGLTVPAKFHADHGDYAVDDERILTALAVPGKHALVFTLAAGEESDLLEGTLDVAGASEEHAHGTDGAQRHVRWAWIAGGALLALLLAGLAGRFFRRTS